MVGAGWIIHDKVFMFGYFFFSGCGMEERISNLDERIRRLELEVRELSERLKGLLLSVDGIGDHKRRNCAHNYGGLCHSWVWDGYPEHLRGVFRVERCASDACSAKGRKYHIEPTSARCAVCHSFAFKMV